MVEKLQTRPNKLVPTRICILLLFLFSTGFLFPLAAQENPAGHALSLDEAVTLARRQSPDVRIAVNQPKNRYWQYRFYQSNYLPQLRLSGTVPDFNRAILPITQPDGSQEFRDVSLSVVNANLSVVQNIGLTGGQVYAGGFFQRIGNFSPVSNRQFSGNPRIGLTQPLFRFDQLLWNRRIQPLLYQEAQHAYLETVEKIAVDATDLYFTALQAQTNLTMAQTNVANNDTLYRISQERFETGKIAENELLQLELALMTARQRFAQAQLDFEKGILQLKAILGFTDNESIQLIAPGRLPDFSVDADTALTQARQNRPQMIGFDRRLTEAKRDVAQARGETGLDANLQVNVEVTQQGPAFNQLFIRPQNQQSVALTFEKKESLLDNLDPSAMDNP